VGNAVAKALDLDIEKKTDRAKIIGLLKVWLKSDALEIVEELDEHRELKKFVKVVEGD
jgi:hypothetical protein